MAVRSSPSKHGSPAAAGSGPVLTGLLWVCQLAVAAYVGIWHAVPKLVGSGTQPEMFDAIGLGQWFRYVVGALELAGSIGLLVPALAGLAAAGLAMLMIGATLTNLFVIPGGYWAGVTAGLFAVCAFIAWGRRAQIKALAARGAAMGGRRSVAT
jgi:putative oxidoreductase